MTTLKHRLAKTVTLAAQQTSVIDLKKIFDQVPGTPQQGGLRVCYRGPVNGLIADGGLEDADIGFSAYLNLGTALTESDTSAPPAAAISLASVGVVFGHPHPDMMFPGPVIFHPYLVVRNTTAAVKTVLLSANYMYGETAETAVLSNITLAPNASQTVDADGLIQRLNLNPLIGYVNLIYAFSGQASDVLISAGSIDGAGTYVFETPPLPSVRSMARTICHWQHGDGVDTKFTIWNHGGSAENLVLTLYFDGGSYKLPIHLAAKASVMLEMEAILARQTPDADGATIPANVFEGSAKLSGSRGEVEHINATVTASSYSPAKATCQRVCVECGSAGYADAFGDPDPIGFAVGATQQLTATGQAANGTQYNITGSVSWASKNTAVSTVSTGGMATAVSVGATSVNFTTADYSPSSVCGSPPVCPYLPPLIVTMPVSVPPTLSLSQPLWFFGLGVIQPPGFTQGATSASLTETGLKAGTFTWTITNGSAKVQFSNGQSAITTTNQTTVTLQSIAASNAQNDVTVGFSYQPTEGPAVIASYQLGVDTPSRSISRGIVDYGRALNDCYTSGNVGYTTYLNFQVVSLFGASISNAYAVESFGPTVTDYPKTNWAQITAGPPTITQSGLFTDQICYTVPGAFPALQPPATPPNMVLINHAVQTWTVGNKTGGVNVQTETLQRYQDHGCYLNFQSPPGSAYPINICN